MTPATLADSVTSIGSVAFLNCEALTSVVIPSSVISIGQPAFSSCSTLEDAYCAGTEATCSEAGYTAEVCTCGTPYTRNRVETDAALGHDMGQRLPDPDKEGEERSNCSRCDHYEIRPAAP